MGVSDQVASLVRAVLSAFKVGLAALQSLYSILFFPFFLLLLLMSYFFSLGVLRDFGVFVRVGAEHEPVNEGAGCATLSGKYRVMSGAVLPCIC